MSKARTASILAIGAVAVAISVADDAAGKAKPQPNPAAKPAPAAQSAPSTAKPAPPPASGGLVAIVDPETHQVRQATPAEIAAASSSGGLSITVPGPAPAVHLGPGNAVGVRLNGSADVFAVMTKDPDGKLKMDCVTGEDAASRRIAAPAAKREVLDEK